MNDSQERTTGAKQKLVHELRQLVGIFLYLSGFFMVFKLYTKLILEQYEISYFEYGLTMLKSLALAKIILTGEALRLGEMSRSRRLIVSTLYNAVVFSAFAVAFEILEHIVLGWFRGKYPAEVFAEILDKRWPHLLAMMMVVFLAFIPFFAFREMGRALGGTKLYDLFFRGVKEEGP
jgi:hypothetical protein